MDTNEKLARIIFGDELVDGACQECGGITGHFAGCSKLSVSQDHAETRFLETGKWPEE